MNLRQSKPTWACIHRWSQRAFVLFSAVILWGTGMAKLSSVFGQAKFLSVSDPVFGIPFRYLLLTAAVVELAIAAVCFFGRSDRFAVVIVAWVGTIFLLYRLELIWIQWNGRCRCLGDVTDMLGIPPQTADVLVKAVLVFLLAGSYALVVVPGPKGGGYAIDA